MTKVSARPGAATLSRLVLDPVGGQHERIEFLARDVPGVDPGLQVPVGKAFEDLETNARPASNGGVLPSPQAKTPVERASTSLRERNLEARRQQILNAARALLSRGGIAALSMRKLAEEASLSVNTLYYLWGTREEILRALTLDARDRMKASLPIDASSEDPIEHCRTLARATVREMCRQHELFRPMILAWLEGEILLHADSERRLEDEPLRGRHGARDSRRGRFDLGTAIGPPYFVSKSTKVEPKYGQAHVAQRPASGCGRPTL